MVVETLGEALSYGWRRQRALRSGKPEGMKRHRECMYHAEVDRLLPGAGLDRLRRDLRALA